MYRVYMLIFFHVFLGIFKDLADHAYDRVVDFIKSSAKNIWMTSFYDASPSTDTHLWSHFVMRHQVLPLSFMTSFCDASPSTATHLLCFYGHNMRDDVADIYTQSLVVITYIIDVD